MFRKLFVAILGLALVGSVQASAGPAPGPAVPSMLNLPARQAALQMIVPLNKSQLLNVDRRFGEISVGNREIADVVPLTRNLIYVLGKMRGTTNVTLSDDAGNIIAVVDVVVTFDIEGLQRSFTALVPDESISVSPAADALVLSGQVSSSDRLRQILSVAERYAPNAVTNLMTLGASQQVLLQVRFAEVQRTALKNLGANFLGRLTPAEGTAAIGSGQGIPPDAFGAVIGMFGDSRYSLSASIDALEQRGLLRTLAEPNLVALSGDTASFLAGGQIPIPVAQAGLVSAAGQGLITVEYKDFGVSLSFTPTVLGKELINLEIVSEVSQIDPTLSVDTGIVSVPGLKIRRARTTIEMKDGQSFSIAGLLQDDFQDGVSQFPLLQRIPVLGILFRSSNYRQQQTELVVLITTRLVDPGVARSLASPTDAVVLPSPFSLFGEGKTEETGKAEVNPSGFVLP